MHVVCCSLCVADSVQTVSVPTWLHVFSIKGLPMILTMGVTGLEHLHVCRRVQTVLWCVCVCVCVCVCLCACVCVCVQMCVTNPYSVCATVHFH